MILIPGKIPVMIHPFFWLFAALIGWLSSGSMLGVAVWVGIIFVSVLIHEFGHALTAVMFRQKARIQLIALGGVTSFDGPKLKFWQQFLITFNGPLFGFLLFVLASGLLQAAWPPLMMKILKITQIANLFWTAVNLLPVMPLDGGQLLRIALEAFFGVKGFRAALLIGAVLAAGIALASFLFQAFLLGAFFFLFAFQSFDSWRKSRYIGSADRDEETRKLMMAAEQAMELNHKEEAKQLLAQVKDKGGILAAAAMQYLAFFAYKEGKHDEAYGLLMPLKSQLADDALCLLHELAAERKEDALVMELSARCYQLNPTQKAALRNARAFARQNEAISAGGWLQTAWQYGGLDLKNVLQEESFAKVKEQGEFKEFLKGL